MSLRVSLKRCGCGKCDLHWIVPHEGLDLDHETALGLNLADLKRAGYSGPDLSPNEACSVHVSLTIEACRSQALEETR